MAKRNQAPEEFIRDYIRRGFTREQILSRASKKDQGFYRLVSEILNHTTLIEKIEKQVEGVQQSQINFEKQSYSSKTILDDIEKRIINDKKSEKEIRIVAKPRDNGRSNLPIHTDLEMNDLDAPLPDVFKTKKTAFTISNSKKDNSSSEKEISLFDEVQQETTIENKQATSENKLLLFPLVQKETLSNETSKFPESKIEETFNQATCNDIPLTESKIEESSNFTDLEKEKLIYMLKQKELLLTELNRNLGNKEAALQVNQKIAEERKTMQAAEIKDLKQKTSIYRISLYVAAGIFVFSICIVKIASINSSSATQINTPHNSNIAQIREIERNINLESDVKNKNFVVVDYKEDKQENTLVKPKELNISSSPETIHLIKKGETFWKITGQYLGKENAHLYKKLMHYNGITNESAPVGKTIKIPTFAELEAE